MFGKNFTSMLRKPLTYIVPATCGVATVEMARRAKVFESPSLDTYADRYGLVNWVTTHVQLSSTEKHCYDSNLERSIRFGQHDLVDRLTMDGKVFELDVNTALRSAVKHNNAAAVSLLLLRGSTLIDINSIVDNCTLLSLAVRNGNVGIVEVLLRFGADPNVIDIPEIGYVPTSSLWWAVDNPTPSNIKIIKLLLKHGAIIDFVNGNGIPLLHSAAVTGNDEIINLLLDNGANVNILDKNNLNLLHTMCAYKVKNFELVEKLVKLGIDINAVDGDGKTAHYMAYNSNLFEFCDVLEKCGADTSIEPHFKAYNRWYAESLRRKFAN